MTPPATRLRYAGKTDKGLARTNNEDYMAISEAAGKGALANSSNSFKPCPQYGVLFLVSDGVGGQNAGEVASQMTVETVTATVANRLKRGESSRQPDPAKVLNKAIQAAHETVRDEAAKNPNRSTMAATLTALWVRNGEAFVGQVGDSRLYRYRKGELEQLTEDQSEVGRLLKSGEITEAEARRHPRKNVIAQAVGMETDSFTPVVERIDLMPGDRFLLCSDGLIDGLDDGHLAEYFEDPLPDALDAFAKELIEGGNRASGRDNLTAIVVEIEPSDKPSAVAPRQQPAIGSDSPSRPAGNQPQPRTEHRAPQQLNVNGKKAAVLIPAIAAAVAILVIALLAILLVRSNSALNAIRSEVDEQQQQSGRFQTNLSDLSSRLESIKNTWQKDSAAAQQQQQGLASKQELNAVATQLNVLSGRIEQLRREQNASQQQMRAIEGSIGNLSTKVERIDQLAARQQQAHTAEIENIKAQFGNLQKTVDTMREAQATPLTETSEQPAPEE